jgi:hypothetical protein
MDPRVFVNDAEKRKFLTLTRLELQPLGRPARSQFFLISGVVLWVLRSLTGLLYQPRMIGDGDCGQIGEMQIGRGNQSTRRKPAPAPLRPPQIPHD